MKPASNIQPTTSKLPANFQFSQGSLQAFVDCPRLFQLRYVERLAWPAPEVEPALENECHMQMGSDFHRLVQQHRLGIPKERLAEFATQDEMLSRWWRNYLEDGPNLFGYTQHMETTLSTGVGSHRVIAKYDLIAVQHKNGEPKDQREVQIYDWKTSRKLPKKEWQEKKLQTRVYPWLLVKAGAQLNDGKTIQPEQIEMTYWFSNFPSAPLNFPYSQAQFDKDEAYITSLIEEIQSLGEAEAPKTENEKRCRFCVYRSLCNRGTAAGSIHELEEAFEDEGEFDVSLDFEQIAEIEF